MNKAFLCDRISPQAPKEESIYHSGRIKITSPDQFVPLFLVSYGLDVLSDLKKNVGNLWFDGERWGIPMYETLIKKIRGNKSDNTDKHGTKEMATNHLKTILNSPLPKEYSIVNLQPRHRNDDTTYSDYIPEIYFGQRNLQSIIMNLSNSKSFIVGLGFVAHFSQPMGISRSAASNFKLSPYNYPNRQIRPELLTLIKYKQLARARASIYLGQSLDIPLTDIKVVRPANFINNAIKTSYIGHIAPVLTNIGVKIEYSTVEEMNKYLFPPLQKQTAEEALAKAIRNFDKVEPHIVF